MRRARGLWTIVVLLVLVWTWNGAATTTAPPIVLDNHFSYIVLGGDHIAESVGRYLAAKDSNKTVLVLKGSQCNNVLEPSEPSKLWLEVSYLFAESAHYRGYEFIDPFLHGSKPGIAFTNHTVGFLPPVQQLYAIDPNLQMLTGARPARIIYNKASSTALGVEVSINFETHYVFAREQLIVAGRCKEDYQLLSRAQVLSPAILEKLLRDVPLEIALNSPIVAPIFKINFPASIDYAPTKLPYHLLATELFIETKKNGDNRPNAKINIVLKEQPPNRWIGFCPSLIHTENELYDRRTLLQILMDTIAICRRLGTSETFQTLNLTMVTHQPDPVLSGCMPESPVKSLQCFVNQTLAAAALSSEEQTTATLPSSSYETEWLTKDFRLKSARNLRLLPFGLTSPFLERWWSRIFNPKHAARESGAIMPEKLDVPLATLLDKLKERLKSISKTPH
ncbi:uncharacterized protein LOC118467577 [Anopheles albimanus]|uniref:uncharacterized protein LOC118467577 n=1 Tax=Anopheles albimanus TaxID=7167 RepID=UPI00163ECA94|nr:uncharacterized protein LOC118467577 [Anopheles albimanus]